MTNGLTFMLLSASLLHKCGHGSSMPNCIKPKNNCAKSKSGVNFQVALKQNHAKKSHEMSHACERESVNYAQCPEHTALVYIQTFLAMA